MSKSFTVSFFHKKKGDTGKGSRNRISGNVGQTLSGAQSETAVLQYLQNKYQGQDITIMSLDFQ